MTPRPSPETTTMEALQDVFAVLKCVKCLNIPRQQVWSLVTCEHKYCEACFEQLNQGDLKTCIVCANFEYSEDLTKPDSVSSLILEKLRLLETHINENRPKKAILVDQGVNEVNSEHDEEEEKNSVYYDTASHVSPIKTKEKKRTSDNATTQLPEVIDIEDMFFSGGSDTEAESKRAKARRSLELQKELSLEIRMKENVKGSPEKLKPTNSRSGSKEYVKDMDTDSIPIHSGSESGEEDGEDQLKMSKSTRVSSSSEESFSLLEKHREGTSNSEDSPLLVVPVPNTAAVKHVSPIKPGTTRSSRRQIVTPAKSKAVVDEEPFKGKGLDLENLHSEESGNGYMPDEDSPLVIVPSTKSIAAKSKQPEKKSLDLERMNSRTTLDSSSEEELMDISLSPDPVIQSNSQSRIRLPSVTPEKSKEIESSSSDEDVAVIPVNQNRPKGRPSAKRANTITSSPSEDEEDTPRRYLRRSITPNPKKPNLPTRSSARIKTPQKSQTANNDSKTSSATKPKPNSQIKAIDIDSEDIEDNTEDPTGSIPRQHSSSPPKLTVYGKSPGGSDTSSGFGLVFGSSLAEDVSPLSFVRGKQGISTAATAKPSPKTKITVSSPRTRSRALIPSDTEDEDEDTKIEKSGNVNKKLRDSGSPTAPSLTRYEKIAPRNIGTMDDSGFGQPPKLTQYGNLTKSPSEDSDSSSGFGIVFGKHVLKRMSSQDVPGKLKSSSSTAASNPKPKMKTTATRGKPVEVDSSESEEEPIVVDLEDETKEIKEEAAVRRSGRKNETKLVPRSSSSLFSDSDIEPPVVPVSAKTFKSETEAPPDSEEADSDDEPTTVKKKAASLKMSLKTKPDQKKVKSDTSSPAKQTKTSADIDPTEIPEAKPAPRTGKFSIFKSKNTRNSTEAVVKKDVKINEPAKKTPKKAASRKKSQEASKFKQTVYKQPKVADKNPPEEKPGPSSRKSEPGVQVAESPRTMELRRRGTTETNTTIAPSARKSLKFASVDEQTDRTPPPRIPLKRTRAPEPNTSARPKRMRRFSDASSSTSEISKTSSAAISTPKPRGRQPRAQTATPDSRVSSRRSSQLSSPASSVSSIDKRNPKGETALHLAAKSGNVERVKQLIAMGANLNARDFADWTPLHEAINGKKNNLEIATLLCDAGCHVNTMGLGNETPLHEAARLGNADIIKLLLSHSASTKIRNKFGQFPSDGAKTKEIAKLMDNFKGPIVRQALEGDDGRFNTSLLEKCLIFFAYDVLEDVLEELTEEFKAHITTTLSRDVTHIIFDVESKKARTVPLTLNYLFGVLSGAWLLSSQWIRDSLLGKKLLDPEPYEITGCTTDSRLSLRNGVPKLARLNKELGQPGLFHGMCFYIYKNSSLQKWGKKDLSRCIQAGDGTVLIRDPNPDQVDPLEHPVRFHAQDPQHKLVLTSHLILFSAGNEPAKKHSMEHVKTLSLDWLLHSALNFQLADPDKFRQIT